MTRVARWALACACVATPAAAQQTPARDVRPAPVISAIAGTLVVADPSSTPLARAVVELSSSDVPIRRFVLTDTTGAFAFTNLPPGRYTLMARKAGYVPTMFGAKRAGASGTAVALGANERTRDLVLRIFPGTVVTGAVIDMFGRPSERMSVKAWRFETSESSGERLPAPAKAVRAESLTDDQGAYRLFGLLPGEYLVAASAPADVQAVAARPITDAEIKRGLELLSAPPGPARTRRITRAEAETAPRVYGDAPTFHSSGDSIAEAAKIVLSSAEQRSGVDIVLRVSQVATVTGTVTGASGRAGVVRIADKASTFERTVKWSSGDGDFAIDGVPPGAYTLFATPDGMSTARGRADVFVAGQDVSASVFLQDGGEVSGRVVADGPDALAAVAQVRLTLSGAGRGEWPSKTTRQTADGAFMFPAVASGNYQLRAALPELETGWRVKSAMLDGVDLLDSRVYLRPGESLQDIVVTVTAARSQISGTLQGQDAQPLSDDTIVVFAADSKLWTPLSRRVRSARPASDGTYSVMDLPAGDYIIAAVADMDPDELYSERFLAELAPYGIRLSLGDGERKIQHLKIGR